jgi:hypothetical protein
LATRRRGRVCVSPSEWRRLDSNQRPSDYEPLALTTELRRREPLEVYPRQDSNLRTRLRRPALYPLSYGGLPLTKTNRLCTPDSVVSAICLRRLGATWRGLAWSVLHSFTGLRCDGTEPAWRKAPAPGPAHPPCCRGSLACVPALPTGTLAFPASFHPCRTPGATGLLSVAAVVTPPRGGAPLLAVSQGPHVCGSREVPLTRRPAADQRCVLVRCSAEGET